MAQLRHLLRDGSQPELWQPDSGWRPYEGPLPRLSGVAVGVDTETKDVGLARKLGPGWRLGLGHLCGVSVAWGAGGECRSIYVPVRHPDTPCRGVPEVLSWLEGVFRECETHFFNAGYDLGWLHTEGLRQWPTRLHDAYISSVMLDENQLSYELDDCCARAGIAGKDQSLLADGARAHGVDPKSGIWQLPARFVGPYAEQDAAATLALSQQNLLQIDEEGQRGAYDTEIAMVEVIHHMTRRGIRVNEDKCAQAVAKMRAVRDRALERMCHLTGMCVSMQSVRSPDALEAIFKSQGLTLPRTKPTKAHPAGLPSATKALLKGMDHELGGLVRHARQYDDLAEKFFGTYIIGNLHRGRVHASIHQLRDSDDGVAKGTRSHRLSYSDPPLQQTPARADPDEYPLGLRDPGFHETVANVQAVRSAFEPEDGEIWCSPDYAGQEPRILVHLAAACKFPSGQAMAARYRENPRLDYHQIGADILSWTRKEAKDTNQGLAYGMGADKLARTRGWTLEEALEKLKHYHRVMPYVKELTDLCSTMAKSRGYIRLLDGARCHFDEWQPAGRWGKERGENSQIVPVRTLEAARKRWPNVEILVRAKTHKALNRACQGGAARQMKRAMVACHQAGIRPLIQMHDELSASITTRREAQTMHDCMVGAVRLEVPVVVDLELGPDWGHAKKSLEEVGL